MGEQVVPGIGLMLGFFRVAETVEVGFTFGYDRVFQVRILNLMSLRVFCRMMTCPWSQPVVSRADGAVGGLRRAFLHNLELLPASSLSLCCWPQLRHAVAEFFIAMNGFGMQLFANSS